MLFGQDTSQRAQNSVAEHETLADGVDQGEKHDHGNAARQVPCRLGDGDACDGEQRQQQGSTRNHGPESSASRRQLIQSGLIPSHLMGSALTAKSPLTR